MGNILNYQKAILFTILYYIFLIAIEFWVFLVPEKHEYFLVVFKYSHFISTIITFFFLIGCFVITKRKELLSFYKVDFKFYVLALFLGIGFVYFQSILNIIYYKKTSIEFFKFNYSLEKMGNISVIASVLIVPITEELFFRNFIQRELTIIYKPVKSIIITSFLFAIIHLSFLPFFWENTSFNTHQAYIAIFGGLISGFLFYKTKSIIPSIIFHIFWNLTSWIVILT